MSKKLLTVISIVVFILLAGSGYYIFINRPTAKEVHYHAGFKVYVDDKLQDFSNIKYMTIAPCREHSDEEREISEKELQNDKGHLHDNVGDVVHVHREGGKWKDLFANIRYTFPKDKPVFAFINGKAVEDIMNMPIKANDSIMIFVGTRNKMKEELKNPVTLQRIQEVEKMSELCGTGAKS